VLSVVCISWLPRSTITISNHKTSELQPPIVSYVKDLPNLCSLAGLACSLLAIYFSTTGVFYAALIGMIWAVLFDWADGLIARRMKHRTGNDSVFGGQLDLLIDIVSYGVAPVVLLLSYGKFSPFLLPIAFVVLSAGAVRLSYFSTYGLNEESRYTGLAIDNNNIALVFIFIFESLLPYEVFLMILTASTLSLAALNVSQIKTPKLSGKPINVFLLVAYTVGLTLFYGWKLSH
jgi:phosphatidylserine synthase